MALAALSDLRTLDDPDRHIPETDKLTHSDLATLAQLHLSVDLHLTCRHHGFRFAAAPGKPIGLEQCIEGDEFTEQFEIDGV